MLQDGVIISPIGLDGVKHNSIAIEDNQFKFWHSFLGGVVKRSANTPRGGIGVYAYLVPYRFFSKKQVSGAKHRLRENNL